MATEKTVPTFPTSKERDLWIQFTSERLTTQIFDVVPEAPIEIEALSPLAREALNQFGEFFAEGGADSSPKEEKIRAYALTNPFFASLVVDASFNHQFSYQLTTQSPVFYGNPGRFQTLLAIGECYPYLTHVGDVLADFYHRAYKGVDNGPIITIEPAPDFNPSEIKTNILRALKSLEPKSAACSKSYAILLLERMGAHEKIIEGLEEGIKVLKSAMEALKSASEEATVEDTNAQLLPQIREKSAKALENLQTARKKRDALRIQLFTSAEKYPARQRLILQNPNLVFFTGDILQSLEDQGWDTYTLALLRLCQNPKEDLTDSPPHQKALSVFTIQVLLNGEHDHIFNFDDMPQEERAQLFNHHLGILNELEESELVSEIKADAHVSMTIARVKVYQTRGETRDPDPKDLRTATLFAPLPKDATEEIHHALKTLITYGAHGHDYAGKFLLAHIKKRLDKEEKSLDDYNRTSQILGIARAYLMMSKGSIL